MMFKFYGMLLLGISCLFSCNAQNIPTTDNIDTLAKLLNIKYYEVDSEFEVERIWFNENGLKIKQEIYDKKEDRLKELITYKYNDEGQLISRKEELTNRQKKIFHHEFVYEYDEKGRKILSLILNGIDTSQLEQWRYNEIDSLATYLTYHTPHGTKEREKITKDYMYYANTKNLKEEVIIKNNKNEITITIKDYSKQRILVKEKKVVEGGSLKATYVHDYFTDGKPKMFEQKIVKEEEVILYKKEIFNECGKVLESYQDNKNIQKEVNITYNDDCKIISRKFNDYYDNETNETLILLYDENYSYDNDKLIKHTLKVMDKKTGKKYAFFYENFQYNKKGLLTEHIVDYEVSLYTSTNVAPNTSIWFSKPKLKENYIYNENGQLIEEVLDGNRTTYEYTDTSTIRKIGLKTEIYNLDSTYHQIIELKKFTDRIEKDLGNGKYTYEEIKGIDTSRVMTKVFNDKKEIIYMEYVQKQYNNDDTRRKANFEYYDNGILKLINLVNHYHRSTKYESENELITFNQTYGVHGELTSDVYKQTNLKSNKIITERIFEFKYNNDIELNSFNGTTHSNYVLYENIEYFTQVFMDYGGLYNLTKHSFSGVKKQFTIINIKETSNWITFPNQTYKKYTKIIYNQIGQVKSSVKEVQSDIINLTETIEYEYDRKGMLIKKTENNKSQDKNKALEITSKSINWTYEYYD